MAIPGNGTYVVDGPGTIWAQVIEAWANNVSGGNNNLALTLGTASGYRSARMQTFTAPVYDITYICAGLQSTSLIGLRALNQSPGWRAKAIFLLTTGGAASVQVISFRTLLMPIRRNIWSTWAGVALGTQYDETLVAEASLNSMFLSHWSVHNKYEALIDAVMLYGRVGGSSPSLFAGYGPCEGIDAAAAPTPIDLSPLVTGVDNLNNSTLDVSLDNGRVGVSIKGGTVIGG